MKYIPLRVHTVFSRGKGAVDPAQLSGFAQKNNLKMVCVSDPLSVVSWESFYRAATKLGLRFLPGTEIVFRAAGSALLFPLGVRGYFSTVTSLNSRKLFKMDDVGVIYIPGGRVRNAGKVMENLTKLIPASNLYLGLEWHTGRDILAEAKKMGIPPVWAQPLKWVGDPEKYRTVISVFRHIPVQEVCEDNSVYLYGPLGYGAIAKRWGDTGKQAMKNTFRFAESVNFDFGRSFSSPPHKLLDGGSSSKKRAFEKLKKIVESEIGVRRAGEDEKMRAEQELVKIRDMGFSPYFLIASEISAYCRSKKIYYNIRGSGGSSYILYLLGLSRINPMGHHLLFERFINSLRNELPDIDIDIDSSQREKVLRMVFAKYGKRIAFLSTHKFFKGRSALYEVARGYGFNPEESHKMSREISHFASPAELKGMGKGERMRELYGRASLLEGVYRELSLHLGGVIFSHKKVGESFPLETSPGGYSQVVWDKETIKRLKIFKLDLLGVRGFDVISPHVYGNGIKFDDPEVWNNIRLAKTKGCFQLESSLARENLEKSKPSNLNELAIAVAIIRPGPAKSGMKSAYVQDKAVFHPVLKEIFPYTRGTVIFEEQISILIHYVSGWSLEFSERVRRELKKKKSENFREAFFLAGKERGWIHEDLSLLWKLASDFSSYAFNHAHSVSYAYSAYVSAWMKSRFPVQFFTRLFNSGGGYYPLPVYIEEAKRWGINILPPDVNLSTTRFSEEKGSIRTGLMFVKGIGSRLSSKIVNARKTGFTSLEDFLARTKSGNRELSALMAVSAFNSIGCNGFSSEERKKNWRKYLGFVPAAGTASQRKMV